MFGVTTKSPRDPMLDLLYRLERRMGRIFDEPFAFTDWNGADAATAAWMPLVDIFEEADFIRLVAELPGVKPENVQIAVEGNLLTIKGNKELVAEEKAEKVHRYERTYGAFERAFTLPATVAPDKIKATYEHGVLTVIVPKVEAAKPHVIKIEIAPPQKALK
jgi:HSP20 family protein